MSGSGVSEQTLHSTGIAMLVVASMAVVVRVASNIWLMRTSAAPVSTWWREFKVEDFWLALCYLFFIAVCTLYLYIVPAYERVVKLSEGLIEPYPTSLDDAVFIQKGLFAASSCLWFCLWSAKFSLLCMYKKLFNKLVLYTRLWWAVVIFCFLALVGCIITLIEACSSMHAWFAVGECYTPRDIVHAAISMWYAYAVDVLTDLMVMALPLRLLVSLQMPAMRKLSIAGLFCLGFFCVIASTLRVTQINNGSAQPTVPWLALWGTIESSIAVIIANAPNLYRSVRRITSQSKYSGQGSYGSTGEGNSKSRDRVGHLVTIGGTDYGASGSKSGNNRRRPESADDVSDDIELGGYGKGYATDTGSAESAAPSTHGHDVHAAASLSPHAHNGRRGDVDNSSQEGLVEELRNANGGAVKIDVSGGPGDSAWPSEGSKGIIVTNTHVLQRSQGGSGAFSG